MADNEFQELLEEVKFSIAELDPEDPKTSIHKVKEILRQLVDVLEANVETREEVTEEIEHEFEKT